MDEVNDILKNVRLNTAQKNAIVDGSEYELETKERK